MITSRAPKRIIPQAFPGITPEEVAELIDNSKLMNYPVNTILCHENAIEDTFYLILEGQVEVTKIINNKEARLLKTLSTGDFFGEMALIHKAPRAATVKTITPLIALEIHRDAFDRVLQKSSSVSLAMVREISRRLRENDAMAIDDLRIRASELAEAYQKLAEQEMARRNFLTNIAHQLRTPLMAAGGYLQMLQKGAIPADSVPRALDTVANNVQRITTLVNDILFVQEMDMILDQFEQVDILELVNRVLQDNSEKARARNVEISIQSYPNLPSVSGAAASLVRALSAVIDNSIKFSPEGGKIEIRLHQKDDQVGVEICDHGIGISSEAMPHIFDRFYHLDKSGDELYEGLGIGLAITRQVIQQQKGRLDVTSALGEGSTFIIWLNAWKGTNSSGRPGAIL
jgi:signal transduction histidine kinase